MTRIFTIAFDDLPSEIPIFPLTGVLLLPRGQLPLNIFEPRYLAMVDDAIKSSRLIGMVQTRECGNLYNVGCAGRICSYNETPDGRIEIVLKGVCRFKIQNELSQKDGYRRVTPQWNDFGGDMEPMGCLGIDRDSFIKHLKNYFELHGLSCSWEAVDEASDEKLITCLAMICPFDSKEKQALLEAVCCKQRAQLFMTLLELATKDDGAAKH